MLHPINEEEEEANSDDHLIKYKKISIKCYKVYKEFRNTIKLQIISLDKLREVVLDI